MTQAQLNANAIAALREAQSARLAFSWLVTKQVCQAWCAHYAAYPAG